MRRPRAASLGALLTLGILAGAGPSSAQVPGLPLFHEPFRAPAGIDHGVLMTVGQGGGEGRPRAPSWTLGGRYRFADAWTVQGAAGLHHPVEGGGERGARLQTGGAIERLLLRRAVTVGALGGVGYAAGEGGGVMVVPLGVGATWFIPVTGTGAGPKVGVWTLPRGEWLRRSADGAAKGHLTWAASAGVSAATGAAVGFNLGVEYRAIPDAWAEDPLAPSLPEWSVALLVRLWR